MLRFQAFLKQPLWWGGFLAVLIPLLVILALQYRSLRALETALPAWRKEEMKTFLREVNQETETYYRNEAEKALALPANVIGNRVNGTVVIKGNKNEVLNHVAAAAPYFRQQNFPGAKCFFLAITTMHKGKHWCAILFYDPVSGQMKINQRAPSWLPIMLAFAPYCVKIRQVVPVESAVVGIDLPNKFHLLFKPIADENGKLIAVAGAELDAGYFRSTVLPDAVRRATARLFPQQPQELIVTARDAENQLMMTNQPGAPTEAEAFLNGEFAFRDWTLGVRLSRSTEAQKARQTFVLTISLSVLMAMLLIGGLVLAWRTAAREMKLSQMKSDFVSNVSHELRTPVSSIQVFGELLKHGHANDPAVAREFGEYIETESRRLTSLINNILDFSHIESGRKGYQFAPTDLRTLIAETIKADEVRLKHEGFELRFVATPTPLVAVDAEAIAQAFVNLLDNAAKYSGSARVIEVRVQAQREAVTIAVSDHGIGIAPDEQEKIFEKFYRAGSSLVHDVKGSGLGLSIVRHIVAAHRGHVTVESELGQGSTFTIHLPVPVNADENADAMAMMQPSLEGK
jgi:signal transduction histidine kinase